MQLSDLGFEISACLISLLVPFHQIMEKQELSIQGKQKHKDALAVLYHHVSSTNRKDTIDWEPSQRGVSAPKSQCQEVLW